MAEPVGLASGLLALATFAFQSSITLYKTVESFQDHPKRVRDLIDELEALSGVLGPLTETVSAVRTVDLSALDRPLLRCGNACAEFKQEIKKCVSQSGGTQKTFRGWAKLRYMGDDIDGFRRLLSGYKSTITIALTDANLRVCSATAETIRSYKDLVETANSDLRAHLESIDEKIDVFLADAISETGSDAPELQTMQEERLSTQRCLDICDQLSKHIDEVQLATKRSGSSAENEEPASFPEMLVNEGLHGCRKTLDNTVVKLEQHEKDVFNRFMGKITKVPASEGDTSEIARLREEWENARQSLSICSEANKRLKEKISVIDNYATGDAMQFMVSTDGKTIHGQNKGLGWRSRQVGGHLSDETVRQISRDMITLHVQRPKEEDSQSQDSAYPGPDVGANIEARSQFGARYGRGFMLSPKSSDTPKSPGSYSGK